VRDAIGTFPDAGSVGAVKHPQVRLALATRVLCALREEAASVGPAGRIDPAFDSGLRAAASRGVERDDPGPCVSNGWRCVVRRLDW
jgi:DNA-binding sugar fermentation-stimulating protein